MKLKLNNESYHDIIDVISAALDAKDFYTAGHSTRVGDMCYKLGSCLGMTPNQLEILHIAGHLHDIGKIGIPDHILNKQGSLTEEEYNIMKTHSIIGYNILNKSKNLSYIAKIILHHHERYDGTGYPHHLKGKDIPLESRIIALCDSIDAMKSNRSYRSQMSDSECKKEIIINLSIMYDPEIASCLLDNWNKIILDY